jgi:putative N6-adenine-specific DNA methylase/tRNA (guanine6-N2)-methyltransferase
MGGVGVNALMLSTNKGLEDLVEQEFLAHARAGEMTFDEVILEPFGFEGQVLIHTEAGRDEMLAIAGSMRSVHHVSRFIHEFEVVPAKEGLETIWEELRSIDILDLEDAETFRITGNRRGEHEYTSVDVQRVAGDAVEKRYPHLTVDLEDYDVDVRVDLFQDDVLVGVQYTDGALSNRYEKVYNPKTSLKTTVAYGMLELSRIDRHDIDSLYDPFCGAGTILLEAASLYPDLQLFGSDIDQEAADGTLTNADAADLSGRIETWQADFLEMDPGVVDPVDLIVTNPPFGVRLGANKNFYAFYIEMLAQFERVLTDAGRVVMLVLERGAFRGAMADFPGFSIKHVRIVETGGIYPGVFVLERRQRADDSGS